MIKKKKKKNQPPKKLSVQKKHHAKIQQARQKKSAKQKKGSKGGRWKNILRLLGGFSRISTFAGTAMETATATATTSTSKFNSASGFTDLGVIEVGNSRISSFRGNERDKTVGFDFIRVACVLNDFARFNFTKRAKGGIEEFFSGGRGEVADVDATANVGIRLASSRSASFTRGTARATARMTATTRRSASRRMRALGMSNFDFDVTFTNRHAIHRFHSSIGLAGVGKFDKSVSTRAVRATITHNAAFLNSAIGNDHVVECCIIRVPIKVGNPNAASRRFVHNRLLGIRRRSRGRAGFGFTWAFGASNFDGNGAAFDIGTVESIAGSGGFSVLGEKDEAVAARAFVALIADDTGFLDSPVGFKEFLKGESKGARLNQGKRNFKGLVFEREGKIGHVETVV
jgi:hypothetical protein